MDGAKQLQQAREILNEQGRDPRESLRLAAHEFWKAAFHLPGWPETLQQQAQDLYPYIILQGSIDSTIARLDDAGVAEARQKLLAFCAAVEQWLQKP